MLLDHVITMTTLEEVLETSHVLGLKKETGSLKTNTSWHLRGLLNQVFGRGTLPKHYLKSAGTPHTNLKSVIAPLHPFAEALSRFEALALPLTFSGAL
jgi:hypothetical protein